MSSEVTSTLNHSMIIDWVIPHIQWRLSFRQLNCLLACKILTIQKVLEVRDGKAQQSNGSKFCTSSVRCFPWSGKVCMLVWFLLVFLQQASEGLASTLEVQIRVHLFVWFMLASETTKLLCFLGFLLPFLWRQCSSSMHLYYVSWIGTAMVISAIPIWLPFKAFSSNSCVLDVFYNANRKGWQNLKDMSCEKRRLNKFISVSCLHVDRSFYFMQTFCSEA